MRTGRARLRALLCLVALGALMALAQPAQAVPSTLPPAAPAPTSTEISPGAPDPNPPLGGIGPNGQAVGGSALLQRGVIQPPGSPALPTDLPAAAWVLTDLDTGAVLAAKDPHGRYQPASILKLLTSLVVLPQVAGSQQVIVTPDAADAEGSAVGIVAGGIYTVDQLFTGMLLMSGNDTAMALADAIGGPAATVAQMNTLAQQLGAYDTLVETPSGLDGWQQLTSAYDMALIMRQAASNPRLIAYDEQIASSMPAQDVAGKHYDSFAIDNQGTDYFNTVPGAELAKSGYTDAALGTYVATVKRGGRHLGVVFLRNVRHPLDQWQQASALFDWAQSLPAGTPAVGRLIDPVTAVTTGVSPTPTALPSTATPTAAPSSANPSSTASPAASASPSRSRATASVAPVSAVSSTGGGHASPLAYLVALGGLAVAGLCATSLRRAVHGPADGRSSVARRSPPPSA